MLLAYCMKQASPTLELEETCYAKSPIMFCFLFLGERTRLACQRSLLAIANFSCSLPRAKICASRENRFGETPKPARETRALPNPIRPIVCLGSDHHLFRPGLWKIRLRRATA